MLDSILNINSEKGRGIVSVLNQISFLLTNLLIYWLFSLFFNINPVFFIISTLASFWFFGKFNQWKWFAWLFSITSLFLLFPVSLDGIFPWICGGWLLVSILSARDFFSRTKREGKMDFKLNWNIGGKLVILVPRLLFFSTAYAMFPILVVWVAITGLGVLSGMVSFARSSSSFLNLITAFGIILGFFQFYLQRYEEKIQQKMTNEFVQMTFPAEKFSFLEFEKFIEMRDQFKDLKSLIDNELKRSGFRYISDMASRRNSNQPIAQYFISVSDSNRQSEFDHLDEKATGKKQTELLKSAYTQFFNEKEAEILKEIDKQKTHELLLILLGNPNILDESFPVILTLQKSKEEPKTYRDFMFNTANSIVNKIFKEFLS